MLNRRPFLAAAAAALAARPVLAARPDWADQVGTIRIVTLAGHDGAARLARIKPYTTLLEQSFAVPVTVEVVPSYGEEIAALVGRRADLAYTSVGMYVQAWIASNHNVVPLAAVRQKDGGDTYRGLMVVRADSAIHGIADMKGRSVAWTGTGSAVGYMVPRAALIGMGIDTDRNTYFSKATFAGSAEAAVMGVLDGRWDAAMAWAAADGDPAMGHARGVLRKLADAGKLDMRQLRIIWTTPLVQNEPLVARADTPAAFRDDMRAFHLALGQSHPDAMAALLHTSAADVGSFVPVTPEAYAPIVQLLSARPPPSR